MQPTSTQVPEKFTLYQNYPNPFNPVTNLKFGISKLGFVSLKVYDVLGKEIAVLVNEKLSPGSYSLVFDGSNFNSGVYFYRLTSENFTETKKMLMIK
ncbi:MAG TPA: T9SS type A sorting domain-containing protein [Ignavibacteria bacterium]|nr:T9SS type A sorting domain-containing protein [Ignavibacteria bacterium]